MLNLIIIFVLTNFYYYSDQHRGRVYLQADIRFQNTWFDEISHICYPEAASKSTQIQFCIVLPSQERPPPFLNRLNSIYWWKKAD